MNSVAATFFDLLMFVLPIALPVGLFFLLINILKDTSRKKFIASQETILLEVIPPIEVTKSPAAMELFLTTMYNKGDAENVYEKYIQGKIRPWFSLEIVSLEGNVHFYIWTPKKKVRDIEAQLYAQFPGIEVYQVEDYMAGIEYHDGVELFGAEMELTDPDPYPIKTYVDYGLDKETEEEFKVDPITPLIELFGSLGKGHMMAMQIIFRAHIKEDKDPSKWNKKRDNWLHEAREEIQKIKKEAVIEVQDGDKKKQLPQLTKGEEMKITALERSVSKVGFDVGLRLMYLAEKNTFDGGNIGSMLGSLKQFNSPDLNGFKPARLTKVKYGWLDPMGTKVPAIKAALLEDYKDRAYFWRQYKKHRFLLPAKYVDRKKFILNTEELATIYHYPGRVSGTPTVERVQSKKATAPANLPI
jgi:hypothetical protein